MNDNNNDLGSLGDMVDANTRAALLDMPETDTDTVLVVEAEQLGNATGMVREATQRGPSHIGPWTPRRILDVIASNNANRENMTERQFVAGVKILIAADSQHDTISLTLGGYYSKVLELASGPKVDKDGKPTHAEDTFEEILCSLCENPIPAEYETAERNGNGEIVRMVKVVPTAKQRLAHAVYSELRPDLCNTKSGTQGETLAVKRIGNALAAYTRERKALESARIEAIKAENSILFPAPEDTPDGQAQAQAIAEAEAKGKALTDAARKLLPRTPEQMFIKMYLLARCPDIDTTTTRRTWVIDTFRSMGFPHDKLVKWHAGFLKDHKDNEKEYWDALRAAQAQ